MTWLKDSRGNKCSVEYFGSAEAAQKALDGLKDCDNCTNCSRCSDCSGCYGCSRCSDCSGCYGCSRCSRCSRCSDCSDCSRCSDCSGCYEKKGDEQNARPPIPIIENIHQKVYEAVTAPKALEMGNWHTCETTHCRGGWIVNLAGGAGKRLENFHGTLLAAMLIYDASDPSFKINPGRFFDSNEDALADMKALAERE